MFRMPPLIYTMAEDGLLFRGLTLIHVRTGTRVMAIMSAGNLTGKKKKKKIETHALTHIFPAVSHSLPHLVCALVLGLMALLFKYTDLVDLVSIGTLLVYSLVAFSILVLR